MNIQELLKQSEGKTLEFKRNADSHEGILRTIIAFANTAGGRLIIGVEDKSKEIRGIEEDPHKLEEKLASIIDDSITPQILPEIEVMVWRDLYLLVIEVFPSQIRPHCLKNKKPEEGTYIRLGSSNRLADETMRIELGRIKLKDTFDRQPYPDLASEAIDFQIVSELFKPKEITPKFLESLDLLTEYSGKKVPTIGGIILFGTKRLAYFPDAWIQVGRFDGIKKDKILDTQEIKSYPILAIDEALFFVKKHLMRSIEIPSDNDDRVSFSGSKSGLMHGSLSRHRETWSVPLTAIREALINAVVHADYSQQGAPIRLSIFDDRIEIENPGLLLVGLTIEDIQEGVSKLRNRVLGDIFYRLGLIERWGSGIKKIVDCCKERGLAEPTFTEIGTHFRVILWSQPIAGPLLNQLETTIMDLLGSRNGMSTKEIAECLGISTRAVRMRLVNLLEKELIAAIGSSVNDPNRKYFSRK